MTSHMNLADRSLAFLTYLEDWYRQLPLVPLATVIDSAPETVALISVDMINGFCKEGPLSGERVAALITPVADLFQAAYQQGVRAMVLAQDAHHPETPEFRVYPPHCIAGTSESQTITELASLSFASEMTIIEKNALSIAIATTFDDWMATHPDITTFIVVGDCTDLCVYSAAMYLQLQSHALNRPRRVVVAANLVDTFDTPVSVAREAGIPAHPGDVHHLFFAPYGDEWSRRCWAINLVIQVNAKCLC